MADQIENVQPNEEKKAGGQPRVVWDDSEMKSVYANASHVAGGREEIVLLFGLNQAWHSRHKEIKIQLSDRIILSPQSAKRLSLLLNSVLQDYEKRYGSLDVAPTQTPASTVQ